MAELNNERIKQMQLARLKKLAETTGLVWDLGSGIEIRVDSRQYILRIEGESDKYYHFDLLDEIIKYLFYRLAARFMLKDDRKNAEGILESLAEARNWLDTAISPELLKHTPKITRKSQEPCDDTDLFGR